MKDYFPNECTGCYNNCYECKKEFNGFLLRRIRGLAIARKLKMQTTKRISRELEQITAQLGSMIGGNITHDTK